MGSQPVRGLAVRSAGTPCGWSRSRTPLIKMGRVLAGRCHRPGTRAATWLSARRQSAQLPRPLVSVLRFSLPLLVALVPVLLP